jgi:hypothetical protein
MKFKFVEIEELLNEKTVDLLFISETKIDSSFRTIKGIRTDILY